MSCHQILRDLKYCDTEFPRAAIEAARQHRDEIIPGLIAEIHDATKASERNEPVSTWAHIAGLCLLSEFEAKEAWPAILISMSSENASELWGDFVTEDLPQVAARLADSPDQFALAIDNPDVYEFVRGSLVEAVFRMVCEERISRETAVQFLRDRLVAAVQSEDTHVATRAVEMLGQLYAKEAHDQVKAAERCDLVDCSWIGEGYFDKQLASGPAALEEGRQRYRYRDAKTATDDLATLPWFHQKRKEPKTVAEAVKEIREPFTTFPADAVRWARKHREEITSHLIQLIENVPEYAKRRAADSDLPERHGHIIALYLLTEFAVKEILPTLLCILNHSDKEVVGSFHDVIDQDMAQILGRLADDPNQLSTLIFNMDADPVLRRDATDAIIWMVTEGKLNRDAAISLLLDWLNASCRNHDTILTTCIAGSLIDLGASDACQLLTEACDEGEMEEMWICTEEIEDALSRGDDTFLQTLDDHRADRIEHTVVELVDWDWDGARAATSNLWGDEEDADDLDDWDEDDLSDGEDFRRMWLQARDQSLPLPPLNQPSEKGRHFGPEVIAPIRLEGPKVGRNDPCPCGSGKKYKKCCAKAGD